MTGAALRAEPQNTQTTPKRPALIVATLAGRTRARGFFREFCVFRGFAKRDLDHAGCGNPSFLCLTDGGQSKRVKSEEMRTCCLIDFTVASRF